MRQPLHIHNGVWLDARSVVALVRSSKGQTQVYLEGSSTAILVQVPINEVAMMIGWVGKNNTTCRREV